MEQSTWLEQLPSGTFVERRFMLFTPPDDGAFALSFFLPTVVTSLVGENLRSSRVLLARAREEPLANLRGDNPDNAVAGLVVTSQLVASTLTTAVPLAAGLITAQGEPAFPLKVLHDTVPMKATVPASCVFGSPDGGGTRIPGGGWYFAPGSFLYILTESTALGALFGFWLMEAHLPRETHDARDG